MRFDDMLATLLAWPPKGTGACIALWRQLVDLLAQGRFTSDPVLGAKAYDCIETLRSRVPAAIKAETARSFAGVPVSGAVVALFAEEPAPVVAPIIAGAQLDAQTWLELIPRLTPTARSLLRHRRDLPSEVVRALDSFGPADFVLPVERDEIGSGAGDVGSWTAAEAISVPESGPAPEPAPEPEPAFVVEPWPFLKPGPVAAADAAPQSEPAPSSAPRSIDDIDGGTQIRELMARIDAYHSRDFTREVEAAPPASPVEPEHADTHGFRFETGADGTIRWVDGVPRGALIGETIAMAALGGNHGVDGQAAGAYRQRAPFRDARLTIGGESAVAGEWRISAVPVFDHADGRFTGYRGTARRPRIDEIAMPTTEPGIFGGAATADSLRQLVHELRTPLNAIIGFSEMIEGQVLGPASTGYRAKASDIGSQGRRLLSALEDLDFSAKLEPGEGDEVRVDLAALLERMHGEYLPMAEERGFRLKFKIRTGLAEVVADPAAVERMVSRLLSATLALARNGESIRVELMADPRASGRLLLSISRPVALAGRDERTLLDPGYHPDGELEDAPVLGLGFALRLVRNIAKTCGGMLDIESDRLLLRLPTRKAVAKRGKG